MSAEVNNFVNNIFLNSVTDSLNGAQELKIPGTGGKKKGAKKSGKKKKKTVTAPEISIAEEAEEHDNSYAVDDQPVM